MMTTRRLRQILMHAALGVVPFVVPAVPAVVAVGSAGCCGEGIESHDLLVPIGDPAFGPLIEACALDDAACEQLCAKALGEAGLTAPGPDEDGDDAGAAELTRCVMTAYDDDLVKLETTVAIPPGGCGG